ELARLGRFLEVHGFALDAPRFQDFREALDRGIVERAGSLDDSHLVVRPGEAEDVVGVFTKKDGAMRLAGDGTSADRRLVVELDDVFVVAEPFTGDDFPLAGRVVGSQRQADRELAELGGAEQFMAYSAERVDDLQMDR